MSVGTASHWGFAVESYKTGDLPAAASWLTRLLEGNPEHSEALHLLGVIHARAQSFESAIQLLARALSHDPQNGEFSGNLVAACLRYAAALVEGGHLSDAESVLERARALDPDNPQALGDLGAVIAHQGRYAEAEGFLRRSLELRPDHAVTQHNLGTVLRNLGRAGESLQTLWARVRQTPENSIAWVEFTDAFAVAEFAEEGDVGSLERILLACLAQDYLEHQKLAHAASRILAVTEGIGDWLRKAAHLDARELADRLEDRDVDEVARPVVELLLERAVVPTPEWERLFTAIRRKCLEWVCVEGKLPDILRARSGFVFSLACQSHLNGFVFDESEEEHTLLDQLVGRLSDLTDRSALDRQIGIGVLAQYRPLLSWPDIPELVTLGKGHPDPAFIRLLLRQVEEPLTELELRDELPSFGEEDVEETSALVRTMYEESPYPRWQSIDRRSPRPLAAVLSGLFPWVEPGALATPEAPDVLVAGCGTGRQTAQAADRYLDAKITGIDLSRSSLAYARRQLDRLGLKSVELVRTDLLALGSWDRRFDVIECVGVLHHLREPRQGAAVLTELLRPGGLMKIGLYSELARTEVVRLRSRIEEEGWSATPDGIRAFRAKLLDEAIAGPHPSTLLSWRDFYLLDECRDLLFHVQEHRFTIERIRNLLEWCGLEFIGFEVTAETRRAFREWSSEASGEDCSLSAWERFENANPETFGGMYQFWVQKPVVATG